MDVQCAKARVIGPVPFDRGTTDPDLLGDRWRCTMPMGSTELLSQNHRPIQSERGQGRMSVV
jgi:hypothetical protein